MNPLVNITIPTWNKDWTLKHALDCALNQDYSLTTITIIDDASTDTTQEKIQSILNHPRLSYIKLADNVGIGQVRNLSLLFSRFDAITSLDADDQMPYQAITKKIAALNQKIPSPSVIDQQTIANQLRPQIDIVYTQCHYQRSQGKFETSGDFRFFLPQLAPGLFFPNQGEWDDYFIHTNSGLYRKEIYQTLGGYFPLRQMEDTEFQYRTILYGYNIHLLKEPLYVYYRSTNNTTNQPQVGNQPWLETAKFITDRVKQMKVITDPAQFQQQFTVPIDLTDVNIELITNPHLLTINKDIPATPQTYDWAQAQLNRFQT